MSSKTNKKPIALAVGAALATSLIAAQAGATSSPFSAQQLAKAYMLNAEDGKGGEGKCGGAKAEDGGDKSAEGKCGEGKCGEGKCGGDKSGGDKPGPEGAGGAPEGEQAPAE